MENLPSQAEIQKITVICDLSEYDQMIESIEKIGEIAFRMDTQEGFVCLVVTKNPIVIPAPQENNPEDSK